MTGFPYVFAVDYGVLESALEITFMRHEEVIGLIGVVLVLMMYFLLQIKKIRSEDLVYSLVNFIGSCLILYSLCINFNLPSFIIEIAWLMISAFGIYQWKRKQPSHSVRIESDPD